MFNNYWLWQNGSTLSYGSDSHPFGCFFSKVESEVTTPLTLSKQLGYVTAGYPGSLATWCQNPWRGLPPWAYVNVNWLPSQMLIKWRWAQHSKQCKHLRWPCKTSISDKNGHSKSKEQKCRGIWGALLEERFCFRTQSLKHKLLRVSVSVEKGWSLQFGSSCVFLPLLFLLHLLFFGSDDRISWAK